MVSPPKLFELLNETISGALAQSLACQPPAGISSFQPHRLLLPLSPSLQAVLRIAKTPLAWGPLFFPRWLKGTVKPAALP